MLTVVFTGRESFLMAAIPAALAAMRLASGEPCPAGVVPVHQHVSVGALADALTRYGIRIDRRAPRFSWSRSSRAIRRRRSA